MPKRIKVRPSTDRSYFRKTAMRTHKRNLIMRTRGGDRN